MENLEGRIKRLKKILESPLTVEFSKAHEQIEEIMERPVWTHEMAFPETLYEEIRNGKKGEAFGKSLIKATEMTQSKKAIIVTPQETEGIPLGVKVVGVLDLSKKGKSKE